MFFKLLKSALQKNSSFGFLGWIFACWQKTKCAICAVAFHFNISFMFCLFLGLSLHYPQLMYKPNVAKRNKKQTN